MRYKGGIFITQNPKFFVGIDSHKYLHTATVINQDTDILLTFTFKNEPQHYPHALQKIQKVIHNHSVIFGLEDTMSFGLHFSYYLQEYNYEVKQVDPALASGYRKSLPNYHKSDEFDSFCVAKVLRDEYKRIPTFKHEILFTNIRLLVNIREQVVKRQVANYLLLHQQLAKVYPGYRKFFSTTKKRGALAFFSHFPSPRYLKGYTAQELSQEMRQYTTQFRIATSTKILEIVRTNPIPFTDVIVESVIVELIREIYNNEDRMSVLEQQLEELLQQTGYQLDTIPSIGIVTAAKLVSEIGNIQRFTHHRQLAKYAGIAPTSAGSAGKKKEYASKGGNRELRAIFFYIAIGMIAVTNQGKARNENLRNYYLKKVAEGKTNTQALVCIMRRLVKIVYSLMKSQKAYIEPNKKSEDSTDK